MGRIFVNNYYWQKLENSAFKKQVWNSLLFIPEEMVIRWNQLDSYSKYPPCFQIVINKGVFWITWTTSKIFGACGAENLIFGRFRRFWGSNFFPAFGRKKTCNKQGVVFWIRIQLIHEACRAAWSRASTRSSTFSSEIYSIGKRSDFKFMKIENT